MQGAKDLYELLGIPPQASQEEIRGAHRKLVRRYHPDANPNDPRAEERFKQVQQAYEILSDETKRQQYDEQFFHTSSRGSSSRPRPRRGGARPKQRETTSSAADLSDLLDKLKNIFENARTGGSSVMDEGVSDGKPSGVGDKPREKKVKGPGAQGREKRVKGPSARRKGRSN